AMISKSGNNDPIKLYLNSVIFYAPLVILSMYSLARSIFGKAGTAGTVAIIYMGYHLIYGGMLFVGLTFYPNNSCWMIFMPVAISLALKYLDSHAKGFLFLTAIVSTGMSIIHVLWGLNYFVSIFIFFTFYCLFKSEFFPKLSEGFKKNALNKISLILAAGLFVFPYCLALLSMFARRNERGLYVKFTENFFGNNDLIYSLILFLLMPILFLTLTLRREFSNFFKDLMQSPEKKAHLKRLAQVFLLTLLISLPYLYLRYQAIQKGISSVTGQEDHPYKAFITDQLFYLNPTLNSYNNPNQSFFPLYYGGFLLLPFMWRALKEKRVWSIFVLANILVMPLITFSPVLSPVFAKIAHFAYLRRISRFTSIFSIIVTGFSLHNVLTRAIVFEKKNLQFGASVIAASIVINTLFMGIKTEPIYFNNLFRKVLVIVKNLPRDQLGWYDPAVGRYDPAVFDYIKENIEPETVIMSDMFTSYRLTAYSNHYVVARFKGGTSIADQNQRVRDNLTFFHPQVSIKQMQQILEKYKSPYIVINRDPNYRSREMTCGYPHTIAKLGSHPELFKKVYDQGTYVIFRYLGI
ncbi:MAG: hypothetical protein JSU92_11440, partial [Deltaproteobacteria bacterium]